LREPFLVERERKNVMSDGCRVSTSVRYELQSARQALQNGVWAPLPQDQARAFIHAKGAKKVGHLGELAVAPAPLTSTGATLSRGTDVFEVPSSVSCLPNFIVKMKVGSKTEYGLLRTDIRR
jgi:hypothetical protein